MDTHLDDRLLTGQYIYREFSVFEQKNNIIQLYVAEMNIKIFTSGRKSS